MSNSNSNNRTELSRRQALLLPATAGMGAVLALPAMASDSTKTATHQEAGTCSTPRSAIANTQYGKVRGFVSGGVLTFKGVPYGQNTGGENRWLPAKPPVPWKDEYPALIYGPNCPQHLHTWDIEQTFIQDWDDGYMGEDMLKLNIWTPSLTGKRAVMFYIHGGQFEFGSSYELPSHEGAQMARNHDVVQVSVNHRLNALGLLDVSEVGGSAYEGSVNVEFTDLVAALKWVRENISNFGGDPDKVMIYGQSGGGSKTTTLCGMPSAAGLIHRASAQSGGGGAVLDPAESKEFARQVMKELGIQGKDIAALQKMEWSKLYAAGRTARTNMSGPGARTAWSPTLDGKIITVKSFIDVAPEVSKNVPMLMGSVSEEGNHMASRPTEAEWHETVAKAFGEAKATAVIAALKKAHPEKSIRQLSYMCPGPSLNTLLMRNNVVKMSRLKYEQKGAPVYTYYFTWQSPMLEDAGAWHTAELAFCFDNVKRCEQATGNTPEAQALAKKMANAWANFARTGNPSQPGLTWTPTNPDRCPTMIFDNQCRMVDDPLSEARKILL
jgi:para-nitrobenzyl esterase